MSDFEINLNKVKSAGITIADLGTRTSRYESSIQLARSRLLGPQFELIREVLKGLEGRVKQEGAHVHTSGTRLTEIVQRYQSIEKDVTSSASRLIKALERIKEKINKAYEEYQKKMIELLLGIIEYYRNRPDSRTVEPYEIDSIVFDEYGGYGGDQGNLIHNADTEKKQWIYENVIKKNIPGADWTSEELDDYYSNINRTGCGYIALINTIFVAYQGREAEFERTFGYPMYDKNGELNYDVLFADIYSSHHNDGTTFEGLKPVESTKLIESFMEDHGVSVDAKVTNDVSPANIDTMLYDGKQVIISYYCGNIYPADGGQPHAITAHGMEITGVTADGKYIVSSWGEKYYLDPNEVVSRAGEDSNGNPVTKTTSMTYTVISYH